MNSHVIGATIFAEPAKRVTAFHQKSLVIFKILFAFKKLSPA